MHRRWYLWVRPSRRDRCTYRAFCVYGLIETAGGVVRFCRAGPMKLKKDHKRKPAPKRTRNREQVAGKRPKPKLLRSATQYHALPEKSKHSLERSLRVLSKLRNEKTSLKKASQEVGIRPETVKRWAGSALKKQPNGKIAPKSSDQLLRVLRVPSADGLRDVAIRGSRNATFLAEYFNALHRYLATGQFADLERFRGHFITDADGVQIPLPTDRAELKRFGSAGFYFESIYSHTA